MRAGIVRRLFIVVAVGLLIWGGHELFQRQRGFERANELAQFGLWEQARHELGRYLQLHPRDARAHLMMAGLWINDDQLLSNETVPRALAHLRRIPEGSPLAAPAQIQQAKLLFLVSHKPVEAERLLREAIRRDENSLEAHQLLCKLLEMTGRQDYSEPHFWRAYELSPPVERAARLRDWYMSQFFPLTANEALERQMGFSSVSTATLPAEAVRYLRFRETEPDEPLGRAVLARWTRRAGKPAEALDLLNLDDGNLDEELRDPFFVATLVDSLIDLGEYEQAEARFRDWPDPAEGFDYWRLKGVILEEVHHQYAAALEAYDLALAIWPGPTDWGLLHRKAGCLAKAGRREEAVQVRAQAEKVTQLMSDEVHKRLRYVLGFLENPEYLREVAEFYRSLGRTREADAWTREAALRVAHTLE